MPGKRNNYTHVYLYMTTLCVMCVLNPYAANVEQNCRTVLTADRISHVYSIGETMHLQCTAECNGNETTDISHLYIRHTTSTNLPGTCIESDHMTEDYANFTVENVQSSDAGTYTCLNNRPNCAADLQSNETGACTDVSSNCSQVGFLSLFLVCIQDEITSASISCVTSEGFSKLTCSWTNQSRDQTDAVYWLMQYKTQSMPGYKCCYNDDITDTCAGLSLLTSCSIPPRDVHRNELYTMRLLAKSCANADNYTTVETRTVKADDSILRLYPADIREVRNTTQRQLDIDVTLDTSPASLIGGVICHVTGVSQWKVEPEYNATISINDINLEETLLLSDLRPYTDYTLNISCRPGRSPFWSDMVQTHGRTRAEPPSQVPTISAYTEKKISVDAIQLYMYLEPIPERCRNGESAASMVTIVNGTSHTVTTQEYATGHVTVVVSQSVIPDRKYQVHIRARNEAGVAAITTNLEITTTSTDSPLCDVVVEEEASGTYRVTVLAENTSHPVPVRRYVWCQGNSNIFPPDCRSPVQMAPAVGSPVVKPGPADLGNFWYFGIALSDSPTIPLVTWSNCSFSLLDKNNGRPKSLDVTVDRDRLSQNASYVAVNLNFRYCDLPSRPLLYQLVVVVRGANCSTQSGDMMNFTATPRLRRLYVPVDDPHTVEICFMTLYSDGEESDFTTLPLFGNQQLAASPHESSNDENSLSVVVGCSVGVGVLVCVALIVIVNRLRAKLTKTYDIETMFLHEGMETGSTGTPQTIREPEHALENSRRHSVPPNITEPFGTDKRPDNVSLPYRQLPRSQETEQRDNGTDKAAVREVTLEEDIETYVTNSTDGSTVDYSQLTWNNTQEAEDSVYPIRDNDIKLTNILQSHTADCNTDGEVINRVYDVQREGNIMVSNQFELDRSNEVNSDTNQFELDRSNEVNSDTNQFELDRSNEVNSDTNQFELDRSNEVNSDTFNESQIDVDNNVRANVENEFNASAETCDEYISVETIGVNLSEASVGGNNLLNGTLVRVEETQGHYDSGIRQKRNTDFDFEMKLVDMQDELEISSYIQVDMTDINENTCVNIPNHITLQRDDNNDYNTPQRFCQASSKTVKTIKQLDTSERKITNELTIEDITQDAPDSYQVAEVCLPKDQALVCESVSDRLRVVDFDTGIIKEAETNIDSYQKVCIDRDDASDKDDTTNTNSDRDSTSDVSSYIRYDDGDSVDSDDVISASDG